MAVSPIGPYLGPRYEFDGPEPPEPEWSIAPVVSIPRPLPEYGDGNRILLNRLNGLLERQRARVGVFEQYYRGDHPLLFATSRFRRAFGNLFGEFSDNWCDLVVDASVERLQVQGFRFGGQRTSTKAWDIWQANNLDADSLLAHTEAVKCGEAFLIVAPNDEGELPQISVEHPAQVVVQHEPGSRRRRTAALKRWVGDDNYVYATLYLPDGILKYRSEKPLHESDWSSLKWRVRDAAVRNELGVVPVIPLRNNPSLVWGGQSDIEKVIPLQNAVNKLFADMIVASEYAGFRQRWATGIEVPTDPDTGAALDGSKWLSEISRVWTTAAPDAKFGDFEATDLGNYVGAIEMTIQHIAAHTRTPPHYLLGQSGAFPSGESLKATETGLVAKVKRKQVDFGEAWEEATALALRLAGTPAADPSNAQTIWADPESRTWGEVSDALVKAQDIGIPQEILWERWGLTPQEIERAQTLPAPPVRTNPSEGPNGPQDGSPPV